MNDPTHASRRTALKTMTTTLVGGGLLAGTASGTPGPLGEARGRREVVEIATEHDHETGEHRFELSTHEADAGWTTFELDNSTEHVHFAYFAKLPAQALTDAEAMGLTPLELYVESVTRPFQFFWDGLVPGKEPDPADDTDLYDSLFPPWFGEVQFYGGPGLTAAETESTTTVALDPGEYVVECYVKTNNRFHTFNPDPDAYGMVHELEVVASEERRRPPEPTLELNAEEEEPEHVEEQMPGPTVDEHIGERLPDPRLDDDRRRDERHPVDDRRRDESQEKDAHVDPDEDERDVVVRKTERPLEKGQSVHALKLWRSSRVVKRGRSAGGASGDHRL